MRECQNAFHADEALMRKRCGCVRIENVNIFGRKGTITNYITITLAHSSKETKVVPSDQKILIDAINKFQVFYIFIIIFLMLFPNWESQYPKTMTMLTGISWNCIIELILTILWVFLGIAGWLGEG